MESRDKKENSALLKTNMVVAVIAWLILIVAKAAGAIAMHWALVWLGILWIPYVVLCTALVITIIVICARSIKDRVHDKLRARNVNAQIRAHAMAFGVWDRPEALGGKALELSAWEHYKIKRKRGETDKELRCRCMIAKADAEERSENHGA